MSERLRLYRMRDGYIEFLHKIDHRVQFNKKSKRPYVGVALQIGNHQYFIPMESPKDNHANLKAGTHLMKLDGGTLGILGINNMIPAKLHHMVPFNIEQEENDQYRRLLQKQINYCNKHREQIFQNAQKTYDGVTNKKTPFLLRVCCDFDKLEQQYTKYYYKTTEN